MCEIADLSKPTISPQLRILLRSAELAATAAAMSSLCNATVSNLTKA
jgi:hypothetical protein